MKQAIFIFSSIGVVLFLAFELSKYALIVRQGDGMSLLILSGLLFIMSGIYLHLSLSPRPANADEMPDQKQSIEKSGLSNQEYTVLILMSQGLSNQEIAKQLMIRESTVKSHVSSILLKLGARRRTEAVKIAIEMKIL